MNNNVHFKSDININNLTCLCTTNDEIEFYQKIITQAGLTTASTNFRTTTTYTDKNYLTNLCFKIIDSSVHKIQPLTNLEQLIITKKK